MICNRVRLQTDVSNGSQYGFTHEAQEGACREDDQDYRYPKTMKQPDVDRTIVCQNGFVTQ